jgi:hypothetical protein
MRSFFAFVRMLLADPRSTRALEETELDWQQEAAGGHSLPGRAVVTLRTFLAGLRVCASSSVREIRYRSRGTLPVSFFSYRVQSGGLLMVIVGGTATLIIADTGITEPGHMNSSLLMCTLGLAGTWREHVNWRRTRHKRLVH